MIIGRHPGRIRPTAWEWVRSVSAPRLSTRQLWVLHAVARHRIDYELLYGDLSAYTLDGRTVSWTLTGLAVRGLVAFDPFTPGPPHITTLGMYAVHGHEL